MKRIRIVSSTQALANKLGVNIANVISIEVFLEPLQEEGQEVAATSSIKPVRPDGKNIDPQALSEFEDFIVNSLGLLDYYGFKYVTHRISPISETSHYISFFPVDKLTGKRKEKRLIYLRLSDHSDKPEDKVERDRWAKRVANRYADWAAEDVPDKKQRWKVHRITVNEKTYPSYDAALDAVDSYLSGL